MSGEGSLCDAKRGHVGSLRESEKTTATDYPRRVMSCEAFLRRVGLIRWNRSADFAQRANERLVDEFERRGDFSSRLRKETQL